jgi:hypothetical protein
VIILIQSIPGYKLEAGQEIRIYRNIRKNVFSIQDKKMRRLIGYGNNILLHNVKMCVSKSGQQRVRREKQKNIHAFIIGTYINCVDIAIDTEWNIAYYNPYTTDSFINLKTNEQIHEARLCYLSNGVCYFKL